MAGRIYGIAMRAIGCRRLKIACGDQPGPAWPAIDCGRPAQALLYRIFNKAHHRFGPAARHMRHNNANRSLILTDSRISPSAQSRPYHHSKCLAAVHHGVSHSSFTLVGPYFRRKRLSPILLDLRRSPYGLTVYACSRHRAIYHGERSPPREIHATTIWVRRPWLNHLSLINRRAATHPLERPHPIRHAR